MHSASPINRCELCGEDFEQYSDLINHYGEKHPRSDDFVKRESAFRRSIVKYRYLYPQSEDNVKIDHFHAPVYQNKVQKTLLSELAHKKSIKFELILISEMVQLDDKGQVFLRIQVPFRSFCLQASVHMRRELPASIQSCFSKIVSSIEEFQHCGSGYVFSHAIALDLEVNQFSGIRVGNMSSNIRINRIPNQTSLQNVPGVKYCFLYCIINFLFPSVKFGMKEEKYEPYLSIFDGLRGNKKVSFPICLKDIPKFIKMNSHLNIKVNVLYYMHASSEKTILPVIFGCGTGEKLLNLLIVPHKNGHHFVLIKSLDKLLRRKYIKNGKHSYANTKVCINCMNSFRSEKKLKEHQKVCLLKGPQKEECPEKGENKIFFKHFDRCVGQELIGYADFEACMVPNDEDKCQLCHTLRCKCEQTSFTRTENTHKSMCYSLVIVNNRNEIVQQCSYVGKDANIHFLQTLFELEGGWLHEYFNHSSTIQMTPKDRLDYENATECYLCQKPFYEQDYKVRGIT